MAQIRASFRPISIECGRISHFDLRVDHIEKKRAHLSTTFFHVELANFSGNPSIITTYILTFSDLTQSPFYAEPAESLIFLSCTQRWRVISRFLLNMQLARPFSKRYDPARPRRAKNLDDTDWNPLKAAVIEYHLQGVTRAQIIKLLATHHNFDAS